MKLTTSRQYTTHFKVLAIAIVALVLLSISYIALRSDTVSAADKRDWVTEDIMSDVVFTDKGSMSVGQIQSFLDQKVGTCDIWGTGKASEFGSSRTRAQYAKSRGWHAPPYVCLNKYYEVPKTTPTKGEPVNNFNKTASTPKGAQSAAWIIKDAANRYNISPKVLLVKIATESAGPLTSDNWPLLSQYRYAMGSNCPDSGPGGSANCDTAYAGFSIQMYSAAGLMRSYLDNMDKPWWSLKRPGKGVNGSNYVGWNVAPTGCGGTNLNIKNKATAALYTYTPYQPNNAALNNMYGKGNSCSAYGNRNFWRVYTDWFGSSKNVGEGAIMNYYNTLSTASQTNLGKMTGTAICTMRNGGCYIRFVNGAILWTKYTGAWESYGPIRDRWMVLGYQNGALGYPTGPARCGSINNGCYQKYENGYIIGSPATGYWESKGGIRSRWNALGYQEGTLGYPTGPEAKMTNSGWQQDYEGGSIVGSYDSGYWVSKGSIREKWLSTGESESPVGFPTADETQASPGVWSQTYQHGAILGSKKTGYWLSKGSIRPVYVSLGEFNSKLGLPIAQEESDGSGVWWQEYQHGFIVGRKGVYHESSGPIRDYWLSLDKWQGKMGFAISEIMSSASGAIWQHFEGGTLIVNPATSHAWESRGSIRQAWADHGYQGGRLGYPTGPEKYSDGIWSQTYDHGIIETKHGKLHRVVYSL